MDPEELWPFPWTHLDVDGAAVAVSQAGSGPPLLFYTGIRSIIWRVVVWRLRDRFRCIVVDPPGIGLSGPVRRAATTLETSARALETATRSLQLEDATLVFHDTGGPAALAAAGRHPERFRALVAINSFGWRPSGFAFRAMLALMGSGPIRMLDLATAFLPRITATSFGVGRHLDASARRAYRAELTRGRGAFHDYLGDARRNDAFYEEVTAALEGPLRQAPLLTIFGEKNDPLGFQPRWKGLFPGVRQVVVPGGNHFPMCDDPALVAEEIAHHASPR